MLRRALVLAVLVSALTAVPALAVQYHSQMKYGDQTSSRSAGGCTITNGWAADSLSVDCAAHKQATLTYTFSTPSKVKGKVRLGVSTGGTGTVKRSVSIGRSSITVTLTITGAVQVNSVSVGYYA